MIWAAVIGGSLACYILKLGGYTLPDRVLNSPGITRVTGFIPVALLAALMGMQTFVSDEGVTVDARIAGLAVALVALLLRAPFIVVVASAAATAAALRWLGLAA